MPGKDQAQKENASESLVSLLSNGTTGQSEKISECLFRVGDLLVLDAREEGSIPGSIEQFKLLQCSRPHSIKRTGPLCFVFGYLLNSIEPGRYESVEETECKVRLHSVLHIERQPLVVPSEHLKRRLINDVVSLTLTDAFLEIIEEGLFLETRPSSDDSEESDDGYDTVALREHLGRRKQELRLDFACTGDLKRGDRLRARNRSYKDFYAW